VRATALQSALGGDEQPRLPDCSGVDVDDIVLVEGDVPPQPAAGVDRPDVASVAVLPTEEDAIGRGGQCDRGVAVLLELA